MNEEGSGSSEGGRNRRSPSFNLQPKKSILKNGKKNSIDMGCQSRAAAPEPLHQVRRNSSSEIPTPSSIIDPNSEFMSNNSTNVGKSVKKLKTAEDFELLRASSIVDEGQEEVVPEGGESEEDRKVKFDEMNIIETLHPADKTYGHMKIEEPKTPYNYYSDEVDSAAGSSEIGAKGGLREERRFSGGCQPSLDQGGEGESSHKCTEQEKELIRIQLEEAAKKLAKHQIIKSDETEESMDMDVQETPEAPTEQDQDDADEESDEEPADEESKAKKKEFEKRRAKHYNEYYAVKLARSLMKDDEDEEEDDHENEGKEDNKEV